MGERINSFRDLNVYQISFKLQQDVFEISKLFPSEEKYSLTDQVRCSSRSIGANLAEAWQKRRYPAHFCSKLTDSDGENSETEHWIETAYACGYLEEAKKTNLMSLCEQIGKMLGSMLNSPEKLCINNK